MIRGIYRDNTKVIMQIDSNLGTCRPIYNWEWDFGEQEKAELLARHFNKCLAEFKTNIAERAWYYLNSDQKSELKKKLRNWDSKKECWK